MKTCLNAHMYFRNTILDMFRAGFSYLPVLARMHGRTYDHQNELEVCKTLHMLTKKCAKCKYPAFCICLD